MISPRVELIDYTGKWAPDPLAAARLLVYAKNTRLTQGIETRTRVSIMSEETIKAELAEIARTIRSSWEFVDYTFEITKVTRAFTHQVVRTRTGSYAQQAMRVVNMGDFDTRVPKSVIEVDDGSHWNDAMLKIGNTYRFYAEHGVPNQDCRGVLPTNVSTNILVKWNLRTVADIVGKRENIRAQDEYADEVVPQIKAEVLRVHPWAVEFLNPPRTQSPAIEQILRERLGGRAPVDDPLVNKAAKELDALKAIWG